MKQIIIGLFIMCIASVNGFSNPMKTELQVLSASDGGFYFVHKIKGTEIRDGVEVDFYKNGKVKTIVNYENGKVNGIWLRLNRNGSTCFRVPFINDIPITLKVCNNGSSGDFYTFSCGCDDD